MADFISDLKSKFKNGNIVIKLIYINSFVFLFTSILTGLFKLFGRDLVPIITSFQLPASLTRLAYQPWSIISYMFMHGGIMHILFNMLWLYWFGQLFLYFFSAKHLRGLYILGGIIGGITYIGAYNMFPYFKDSIDFSFMIGASASVLAIVTATAFKSPNYTIRLLFIGNVKLKYMALFMIISDLLYVTSNNAGGHIAHLGGALIGILFAASLNKGRDLTKWINSSIDSIILLFSKEKWIKKKRPKMNVHFNKRQKDYEFNQKKKNNSKEIDRILDKIRKTGYNNLTSEEKKTLFDASKK